VGTVLDDLLDAGVCPAGSGHRGWSWLTVTHMLSNQPWKASSLLRMYSLNAGVTAVTVAKAYRLLKAIFNTAVDDGLIRRNPCRVKGAGQEKAPERPVLTVPQVYALAAVVDEHYRVLVLLAAFTSLRWGELAALRRSDIDIQARTVRVTRRSLSSMAAGLCSGRRSPKLVSALWRFPS
jgi:integrase